VKRGRIKAGKQPMLIKVSKTDDQYGRYLVDTWVNRSNINRELVEAGVFEVRGDYR